MENLLEYVSRAGAAGFDELQLTKVDLACFTELVYLPMTWLESMPRPSLAKAAQAIVDLEGGKIYNVFLRKRLELMGAMALLPR